MYSLCVLEFATNQLLTIHPNLAFPVEKHDIMCTAEIFLAYYTILMLLVKPGARQRSFWSQLSCCFTDE